MSHHAKRRRIFTEQVATKHWGGQGETVSGDASMLSQTVELRKSLSFLLPQLGITSVFDVGCGDFNWMKEVDLTGIQYVGVDIVDSLIKENKQRYASDHVKFYCMDALTANLPKADLVMCRNVASTLPNDDVKALIDRIKKSHATYLLMECEAVRDANYSNQDIATGEWRWVALEHDPFFLPKPVVMIPGSEKSAPMGLWKLADIRYFNADLIEEIEPMKPKYKSFATFKKSEEYKRYMETGVV